MDSSCACGSCYRDSGVSQLLLPRDSLFSFSCGCGCGSCLPSHEEARSLAQEELLCIDEVAKREEGHGYKADNYHEFLCRLCEGEEGDGYEVDDYSEFLCRLYKGEEGDGCEANDYSEFLRRLLYEGEDGAKGDEGDGYEADD